MRVYQWVTAAGLTMLLGGACSDGAMDPLDGGEDGVNDPFIVDGKVDSAGITEGTAEAAGCLAVANRLSRAELLSKVGLSSNAAAAIIAVRIGDDETVGTADDVSFVTLKQLDDVPYIGPLAFSKILAYARANGFVGMAGSGNGPYGVWRGIKGTNVGDSGEQAFWSGKEMLYWGATWSSSVAYDPASNSWRSLTTTGHPSERRGFASAWSGKELYVFGGVDANSGSTYLNDGARYDPALNKWSPLPMTAAPSGRLRATMVWAGDRMIVFGGYTSTGAVATAAQFVPSENRWYELSAPAAPSPRAGALGVWTGTEIAIWGGNTSRSEQDDAMVTGGLYDPATQRWRPMSTTNAPAGRIHFASAWTGTELLIWGGKNHTSNNMSFIYNNGARYNPRTDTWTALPAVGLSPRWGVSGVFTGSEFVLFGGNDNTRTQRDGSRLVLSSNTWRILSLDGAPSARGDHMAVWTGSAMIVSGGENYLGLQIDGAAWAP